MELEIVSHSRYRTQKALLGISSSYMSSFTLYVLLAPYASVTQNTNIVLGKHIKFNDKLCSTRCDAMRVMAVRAIGA